VWSVKAKTEVREEQLEWIGRPAGSSVLFCSLAVLDLRVGNTMDLLSPFISVILIDSSTGCVVHILMLSIQAVRDLPRLHAFGIVPCIYLFLQAVVGLKMAWCTAYILGRV